MDYEQNTKQLEAAQSLRAVADEVNYALREAHLALSELHDKVCGPTPRPVEKESASNLPQPHPGVRAAAELAAKSASDLLARIRMLSESI